MTREQAETLFEAEHKGVRQLRNVGADGAGGYCAAQWLADRNLFTWGVEVESCPMCGATTYTSGMCPGYPLTSEGALIVHLNNDHRMTFGEIARKLGPDSA